MDLHAYFKRIGYTGSTDPTLATLNALHRAHMQTVPFENLNIHMPRNIVLTEEALFEKIVRENRGGFCFEQNGLFSAVLRQLGFDVTRLEGNVYHADSDSYGIRMNHMTLLVVVDDVRYLVDVGFGSAFSEPLEMDNPDVQIRDVGQFKITHHGDRAIYHKHLNGNDEMTIGYRFFFEAHDFDDYADACVYMQTSPNSPFTQKRVCTRLTDTGRITLSDRHFITTTFAGERTEIPIQDEAHFHALLLSEFGIDVQTHPPKQQV